jgi:hypothetical protein
MIYKVILFLMILGEARCTSSLWIGTSLRAFFDTFVWNNSDVEM